MRGRITKETVGRIAAALNERYAANLKLTSKKAVSAYCREKFSYGNISRENALKRAALELGIQAVCQTRAERQAIFAARQSEKRNFFDSALWRDVRYQALKRDNATCQLCGKDRSGGGIMHVDHIKPCSMFPELALDLNNLQTLCYDCNTGKSNHDATDWRQYKGTLNA